MSRFLAQLSDGTDRLIRWLAVPVGIATIGLVFFEVLMRYVFQAPLITSVELARLGFVWCCFLGAALAVKREKHIRFVFLLDRVPARLAAALRIAVPVLCCGFFLLMLLYGIEMVARVRLSYFPALGFSQLWLYLPLPLSGAAMLIHGLAFLGREIADLAGRVERRR